VVLVTLIVCMSDEGRSAINPAAVLLVTIRDWL